MAHVIAVANPAARSGKTATAARRCLEFAGRGVSVLAVDMDPRAEFTRSFGIDVEGLARSVHDVVVHGVAVSEVLVCTDFGVDVLPAAPDLSLAEGLLMARPGRESALRAVIEAVRGDYEVIVIDCPSSLGLLTVNALSAADELQVPGADAHPRAAAALRGAADEIRRFVNPGLTLPEM